MTNARNDKTLAEAIAEVAWLEKDRKTAAANIAAVHQFFEKCYGGKNKEKTGKKRPSILLTAIKDLHNRPDDFYDGVLEGFRSYASDKYVLSQRLESLLQHLKNRYGMAISGKLPDNFKCRDSNERRLRILKYLHTGDKSREQIAEAFGISERALADDLKALTAEDGYEYLGSRMTIEKLAHTKNTYRSLIHPVFLAMNGSEIYAMTVGLKLLSRGTVFEKDLGRVADEVYAQLSPAAHGIVDWHTEAQEISFDPDDRQFISTSVLMQNSEIPFAYFLKQPIPCQIDYLSGAEKKTAVGTIHLSADVDRDFKRIIVKTDEGTLNLDMAQVLWIGQR